MYQHYFDSISVRPDTHSAECRFPFPTVHTDIPTAQWVLLWWQHWFACSRLGPYIMWCATQLETLVSSCLYARSYWIVRAALCLRPSGRWKTERKTYVQTVTRPDLGLAAFIEEGAPETRETPAVSKLDAVWQVLTFQ